MLRYPAEQRETIWLRNKPLEAVEPTVMIDPKAAYFARIVDVVQRCVIASPKVNRCEFTVNVEEGILMVA